MRNVALAFACALLVPSAASAQGDRARLEVALQEAEAHEQGGRPALAAERYLEAYDLMRRAQMRNAPLVLWNAGHQLAQVPGREREAIDVIRRFLSESTPLADEMAQVRDWRSRALSELDELEARATPSSELAEPTGETESETSSGGGISPIGPIVMGIGGAALIPGLIVVGVAFAQDQDLRSRCPTQVGCDPAIPDDDVESTRNLGIAGDVTWIAGAAVALTGLVLTLVLEETDDDEPGTAFQLQGAPGGAVATLQWRLQ